MQFNIIRLLLSLASIFLFEWGYIGVKEAFLPSSLIKREIYVRLPPPPFSLKGMVQKLLNLSYKIPEVGTQWAFVNEEWLIHELNFERILDLSQSFVKRDNTGRIKLMVAKVTDGILMAGGIPDMV